MLPTKPVERAFIYFPGEKAAGINPQHFEMQIWIDLSCFEEADRKDSLETFRQAIYHLYSEMIEGDYYSHARVTFDFEAEAAEENAGCDRCGTHDRLPGKYLCSYCDAELTGVK